MANKKRSAKTHTFSSAFWSVLGPTVFVCLSWYFYTDSLLGSALIFYAYAVGLVIVVVVGLHVLGIFRDTMIDEFGVVGFIVKSALLALFVGPLLIMLFVGFVSIAAIYARAVMAMPWSTMSFVGCALAALVAAAGPVLQNALWKRVSEDYFLVERHGNSISFERVSPKEQMLRKYSKLPLTFLATHIVLRFLGWTPFAVTIGSFMGAVYSIFFLPMFVSIGIMRAITFRAEPVSQQVCKLVSEVAVLVRPDGLFETIRWLANLGWKFLRLPATDPALFELAMRALPTPHWYDAKWDGSLSLASYLIVAATATSCIVGGP